jgi:histidyl-tRNA synthetase
MVMANLSTQPYRGTRDFYPDEKRVQNYIFSRWASVAESFGYEEYAAPLIEPLDIYTAKSGQELANEQTYTFVDRGGRTVAIRPEMTPSVSRMVAARSKELAFPLRLFSIANFMRYERPQRGREREFWQLNVDIFGDDSVGAEAEIIILADAIMKSFGATSQNYCIRINNRKLINFMMDQYFELDSAQAGLMIKLLDRRNKIKHSEFMEAAAEIFAEKAEAGLPKVEKLLDAKTMADLPEEIRESSAVNEIQELFTLLERADVDSLVFDITLMRGLDYYTGMVFEVYDTNPENSRALFGGGRYDGLVGLFGSDQISAVGMAPGATTFEDFLKVHNLLPELKSTTDVYLGVVGDVVKEANKLAKDLRSSGINVEMDASGRKPGRQIKVALKKGVRFVLFFGNDEAESGIYTLKDVDESKEYKLNFAGIVNLLKGE